MKNYLHIMLIAAVIMLPVGASAQGLFGRGSAITENNTTTPLLPEANALTTDEPAVVPLGNGVLLLLGIGAGYALLSRKKEK